MANSHMNDDFDPSKWLDSLKGKADRMKEKGLSSITAGLAKEESRDEWVHEGMAVRQLPDDEHGILRISVGGGNTPVNLDYCSFRGDREKCAALLAKALDALVSR